MRADLRQLLAQLTEIAPSELTWPRTLLVHNAAPVPPVVAADGDHVANRGFNLLIVGTDGAPEYFCKCRPLDDEGTLREGALMTALSALPGAGGAVPPTRTGATVTMRVVVSRTANGPLLEKRLPQFAPDAWPDVVVDVLARMEALTAAALAAGVIEPAASRVDPSALLEAPLALLAPELPPEAPDALRALVAPFGPRPAVPQHGDLWPRNVLWHDGGWWIVDFERYGELLVPSYDAWHLLRTATLARHGADADVTFLELLAGGGEVGAGARRLARHIAATHGLAPAECLGALAFYLVDLVAMVLRREQVAPVVRERLLRELRDLAERGADPAALAGWLLLG